MLNARGCALKDEAALLRLSRVEFPLAHQAVLILLDGKGKQMSSEELAKFLGDHQDRNPAPLLFAIGPANGFSEKRRGKPRRCGFRWAG